MNILTWELEHLRVAKKDQDIRFLPFPGSDVLPAALSLPGNYTFPKIIYFQDVSEIIHTLDYPYSSTHWSICSSKMLTVLEEVGNLSFNKIPVAILSTKYSPVDSEKLYSSQSNIGDYIIRSDFYALSTTETFDILDKNETKYKKNPLFPDRVMPTAVTSWKFLHNESDLPPLFRVKSVELPIFITSEARSILKKNKITGVAYDNLEINKEKEVDIPIHP
jgi:hypothetical protein